MRLNMRVDESARQIEYEYHRACILSDSKNALRDKLERSAEFVAMRQAYAKKRHAIRLKRDMWRGKPRISAQFYLPASCR